MRPTVASPSPRACCGTLAIALLLAGARHASSQAPTPPTSSIQAVLAAAREQVAGGDLWEAREMLEEMLRRQPSDCTLRAWLAWLDTQQFLWDDAETRLNEAGCPITPEDQGRWSLLRAMTAETQGEIATTRQHLRSISERQPLCSEDRAIDRSLRWRYLPGYTLPLEATAELAAGWTSNAFAGSPVDAARRESVSSLIGRPAGGLRLRAPEGRLTPAMEVRGSAHGVAAERARGRSHANLLIRAGSRLGRRPASPFLAYAHEEVFLSSSVAARYAAAHRFEIETTPSESTSLAAGVGHRTFFSDDWRTRTEWDLAALARVTVAGKPVILATSLRLFDARRPVHDQVGATVTLGTDIPVGARSSLRVVAAGGFDDFPHSGGEDGWTAFGTPERRRDVLARFSAGAWRRLGGDALSLGISYEYTQRWSTADAHAGRYYPYVDHRALVALRIAGGGNPWRRRTTEPPERIPLPYRDLEPAGVLLDDQVRRMLRYHDELTEDCGCQTP